MKTKEIILAALFAALTCILSLIKIPIPISPTPITLQVLAVALSGAILGKKLGFFSQVTYVLLGAIGLPVFAGGTGGLNAIVGPTGGYIIGFIIAAYVIGWLVEKGSKKNTSLTTQYFTILLAMTTGVIIIYILGALQLMVVAKLTLKQAVIQGVVPFIVPDLIKLAVGSGLAYYVRKRLVAAQLLPQDGTATIQ